MPTSSYLEAQPIGMSNRLDGGTQCVTPMPNMDPRVDTIPDFAISAGLFNGLNAATGGGMREVAFFCATGNCTWVEYVSVAVCSSCHDISQHLT